MTIEELNIILSPLLKEVKVYKMELMNIELFQKNILNAIELFNLDLEIFLLNTSSFYKNDKKIKELVIKLKELIKLKQDYEKLIISQFKKNRNKNIQTKFNKLSEQLQIHLHNKTTHSPEFTKTFFYKLYFDECEPLLKKIQAIKVINLYKDFIFKFIYEDFLKQEKDRANKKIIELIDVETWCKQKLSKWNEKWVTNQNADPFDLQNYITEINEIKIKKNFIYKEIELYSEIRRLYQESKQNDNNKSYDQTIAR
ncbi:hypothetical protein [Spiroplasma eriocheiris]|uniref:Uncharacterized protein n=1 Tax=Spiroplasma eriocheiris TaxID=315358 RepID=A0A0H3XHI6_9MOLU|nr:hypothetical protein [Spiroplasma eriocheiris]AHF57722.1 hypothetical protein SPE_0594 [Spiroplasma eriocheiris CCTCC M 207170]AKM54173.1 hypothetical protein SERIO_v1c06020 [Spiroplasma eriocheiris]